MHGVFQPHGLGQVSHIWWSQARKGVGSDNGNDNSRCCGRGRGRLEEADLRVLMGESEVVRKTEF